MVQLLILNLINNALDFINKIKEGKIRIADEKIDQIKFKSDLGEIQKRE